MLNWSNCIKALGFLLVFGFFSESALSSEFSSVVSDIDIGTDPNDGKILLNVDIDFRLSSTAKDALQKGIVLSWVVLIKVEQQRLFWNATIEKRKISYKLKNHALLNLYSVNKNGVTDMFSTLNASLNAMSKIRDFVLINKQAILSDKNYQVAVRVLFNREALPIPLRPISYFDPQWALSSDWVAGKLD